MSGKPIAWVRDWLAQYAPIGEWIECERVEKSSWLSDELGVSEADARAMVDAAVEHWQPTATGYTLRGHELIRGRTWTLRTAAGVEHDLGRSPSFDHAEAILGAAL